MNHIVLIGRLTKDPELKYLPSGKSVCNFVLAVNRPFAKGSDEQKADFINIQVWGKKAEVAGEYLAKGRQCAVSGRLQIRSYEKDGERKYTTEVVADSVEFLGDKAQKASDSEGGFGGFGEEVDFDEESLPF